MMVFALNKGGLSVVTKLFSVSWDFVWNLAAAFLGFGRTSMIPFILLSLPLCCNLWFCAYVCSVTILPSLWWRRCKFVRGQRPSNMPCDPIVWHNSRAIWAARLTQYLSHSLATFHFILSPPFTIYMSTWAPAYNCYRENKHVFNIRICAFAQLSMNLIGKLHSYLVKHERKQKQQRGLLWLWANKVLG